MHFYDCIKGFCVLRIMGKCTSCHWIVTCNPHQYVVCSSEVVVTGGLKHTSFFIQISSPDKVVMFTTIRMIFFFHCISDVGMLQLY